MKKLIALVLALVMCMAFAACGEEAAAPTTAPAASAPDKQPAIDEFNKTSTQFNEVSAIINADIEAFDEEVISTMTEMANLLNQYNELLSSDQEISQENLDEMIAWFGEVQEWVAAVKAELESL